MVSLRRLLTVFLAVALMQFSIAATAPAHAHEGDAPHGVPVVVLDSYPTSPRGAVESGHGHDHSDEAVAVSLDVAALGQPPAPEGRGDRNGSESVTHVHGYAQFAAADAAAFSCPAFALTVLVPPIGDFSLISHSSAPPLRPPRTIL
jgi:hypothetical protein